MKNIIKKFKISVNKLSANARASINFLFGFLSLELYRNLLMLSAIGLSAWFLITAVRTPESDGLIRYNTFLTLLSSNEVHSKYSAIQPILSKLMDILIRSAYSELPVDFVPVNIELILMVFFALFVYNFLKKFRFDLALFLAIVPLSMLSHYAGQFFSEWTSSLLMAIGFSIFLSANNFLDYKNCSQLKSIVFGAFIFALGVANWFVLLVPTVIVLIIAIIRYKFEKEKDVNLIYFLFASVLIALALIIADLFLKNQLFSNGYLSVGEKGFKTLMPFSGISGFSHPLAIGILANIFSFGKSIFLYNPFLLFLIICNYKYKVYVIAALFVTVIVYSKWWAWYGGFSFGTRFYMLFIIPSIFVYIKFIKTETGIIGRALGIFTLAVAIWLALCGKYFGLTGVAAVCSKDNYHLEVLCWYVPEFSPLIYPFIFYGVIKIFEYLNIWDLLYFSIIIFSYIFLFYELNINAVKNYYAKFLR